MSDTETVAQFIQETEYNDVPEEVIEKAKTHIRDTIGVALAGTTMDVGEIVEEYTAASNPGDSAVVFASGTASPAGAAFANGVFAHALEWDDTPGGPHHLSHPTPPTFPAALAAAEHAGASGRELLAGYVTGVEVLSRLELVSFPDHYYHGWHDTSTYGVFGAVAAAASIQGLSVEETKHALGVAASCSAGLRKNNATMTKPFHAGHAASDGLRAAMLAGAGFTADTEILDGDIGYLSVYSAGEADRSTLSTFGAEWHLLDYGYKPYPGITFIHGAQTALRRLVEREDLTPSDVERIEVELKQAAWDTLWNESPGDPLAAIASPEFGLAAILRERDHGLQQFSEAYVTAPETRDQMRKVERALLEDDDFDMFGARVTVETVDGREFVEAEHYSPLSVSSERLDEKFRDCAGTVLAEEAVERVGSATSNLEAAGELDALVAALQ